MTLDFLTVEGESPGEDTCEVVIFYGYDYFETIFDVVCGKFSTGFSSCLISSLTSTFSTFSSAFSSSIILSIVCSEL